MKKIDIRKCLCYNVKNDWNGIRNEMDILIGIVVVFILLLCLGASLELIAMIALGIIMLFIVFMLAVFVYASIVLLVGKRTKGFYIRSETEEKSKIPYAVYMIDGKEYRNMFPLEVIFQKKIYKEEKEVNLILNEKRNRCFDNNAIACCVLGLLVSIFLIIEAVILILGNI